MTITILLGIIISLLLHPNDYEKQIRFSKPIIKSSLFILSFRCRTSPPFHHYSISGFALNYVTPVGLMGGEPYRIMELTPYVGVERATSSVILYVMMHIFSHFCFWLSSVLIYVFFYPVGWGMGIVLGLITLFCLLLVTLFIKG